MENIKNRKNTGYPFQYGDELTPEMARRNRKHCVSYSVLITNVWLHNLGFREPNTGNQSYSIFNETQVTVEQIVSINGGAELGKAGPGPRAKADALKNARKPGRGGIFAEGFTPQRQYHLHPTNDRLICRNNVKRHQNQFNRNEGARYQRGSGSLTENERIFKELSLNPETKLQDPKSVDEARAILHAKRKGLVTNISRPKNPAVKLDFEVTGLGPYEGITHVDIKTPISLKTFELEGKAVSGPNTYREIGNSMGMKLIKQKSKFCGLETGPKSTEKVLHLVDLRKIPSENKIEVTQATLEGALEAGNSTQNIHFINSD